MKKKNGYSEPMDYFPKDVRKKLGLGEFEKSTKKPATKKVKRK